MEGGKPVSIERVRAHLKTLGLEERIHTFPVSSATVELAARAVGCEPGRIIKTLSFSDGQGGCILVLASGDARIDNGKFKAAFGIKARMLSPEQVQAHTGYGVGGVCPFGVGDGVRVCMDQSIRRYDIVYPAAGTSSSMVRLSVEELELASGCREWVDVCKDMEV